MLTTLDHFSPGLDLCPIPFPPRSLPGPLPSPQLAEYSPLFRSGCGDVSQANVEWHVRFVSKVKIRLRKSGTPGCLGNLQIGCGSFEKCWGLSAFFVWQRRVWLKFKAGQDFKALADFELDLSGKKGALELEAFGYEVTGLKCNVYKIFIFQINSVLFYLIKKMYHQFSISQWFLKDHVTLKTGVMVADNYTVASALIVSVISWCFVG